MSFDGSSTHQGYTRLPIFLLLVLGFTGTILYTLLEDEVSVAKEHIKRLEYLPPSDLDLADQTFSVSLDRCVCVWCVLCGCVLCAVCVLCLVCVILCAVCCVRVVCCVCTVSGMSGVGVRALFLLLLL